MYMVLYNTLSTVLYTILSTVLYNILYTYVQAAGGTDFFSKETHLPASFTLH